MQTPPPPYAKLFPNAVTATDCVLAGPLGFCDSSSARPLGAAAGSTRGGNVAGGELTPPPPPPLPLCTDINAPVLSPPTAGASRTSKDAAGGDVILQRLLSLQDEINSIKCRLSDQSLPAVPLVGDAAPVPFALGPSPPAAAPTPASSKEKGDAWKRVLNSQQEQIVSLTEALCRSVSLLTMAPATAIGEDKKELAGTGNKEKSVPVEDTKVNDKHNGNSGTERVSQVTSVGFLKDRTVDLVHLLTTLYNFPVVSCGCCHERLYCTFGEELVAAALGTTSHDLLEHYALLLVLRLNEGYTASEVTADGHTSLDVFAAKGGDVVHKALAPLPLPVLERVLERTQFPSEIPAYQIAFSACDVYHQRRLAKLTPRSSFVPLARPSVATSSSFPSFAPSDHCEAEAVEVLFHEVRFLWLPLRFLENELRRCEGLGLTTEASHCTVYAGLLLRLRQAIQAKRCLKEFSRTPAQPLPVVFTAAPFLTELNRLRPSYDFLTPAEKEQLLAGGKLDFTEPWRLQERCDATL